MERVLSRDGKVPSLIPYKRKGYLHKKNVEIKNHIERNTNSRKDCAIKKWDAKKQASNDVRDAHKSFIDK